MKTIARHLSVSLLLATMLMAYGPVQAGQPDAKSKMQPSVTASAKQHYLYGKVIETMDSGGYTYVHLDTGKEKVWGAGPVTPIKKGDLVRIGTGMPMANFKSNTLKRQFKVIYFSNELKVADDSKQAADDSKQVAADDSMASSNKSVLMRLMTGRSPETLHLKPKTSSHPENTETEGKLPGIKIKRAKHGKTIAEIFKDRKKLAGKEIRVRGKVIKYIGDVYGKNWLHIRDNSTKQDLLVITGDKLPKDQNLVLVKGTVALNKDNGIGHIYPAALDDAKILGK